MAQWLAHNALWLALLVVAAWVVLSRLAERRRVRRLTEACAQLELKRLPEEQIDWLVRPPRFWLLSFPSWARTAELCSGRRRNHEVVLFRLTLPDALHRGQLQTAALVKKVTGVADFVMRPETLRDHVGAVVEGADSVDFPALSRFTGRYHLDGEGRDQGQRLLEKEGPDFLRKESGWCLEVNDGDLLVFQAHDLARTAADLRRQMERALAIADCLSAPADAPSAAPTPGRGD